MKKNLVLVLGLVFLLYPIASCETEDELNSMKSSEPPIQINKESQIELEPNTFDKKKAEAASCDDMESTTLYASNDLEVGLVHISNSENEIFVTYDLKNTTWSLTETHLYVGAEGDIPYASGHPRIGHFPYHAQQNNGNVKEYTFVIPKNDLDTCLVIIAHAVVQRDDRAELKETAFGYGHENDFSGNGWGWFIDYCMQECNDLHENDDKIEDSNGKYEKARDMNSEERAADCLESFAFNSTEESDSQCFLSSGFDQWGWTNQVFYSQQMNYASGYVKSFPLLASAYQCDIRNSLEVGYLTLTITGNDGNFNALAEVTITDQTYDLDSFDLYVGAERYPLDDSLEPTLLPKFYNFRESSIGAKTYSMTDIPWPVNANFIARGVLCPTK